jgi:hypothetical protein
MDIYCLMGGLGERRLVILRIRAGRLGFGNCEYLGLERRRGIWPISFLYIKELLSSLEKR